MGRRRSEIKREMCSKKWKSKWRTKAKHSLTLLAVWQLLHWECAWLRSGVLTLTRTRTAAELWIIQAMDRVSRADQGERNERNKNVWDRSDYEGRDEDSIFSDRIGSRFKEISVNSKSETVFIFCRWSSPLVFNLLFLFPIMRQSNELSESRSWRITKVR